MDSSASSSSSKVESRGINVPANNPPSKIKTFGFAVAIILGIGGFAVGATGLAGYFHAGALSNMAQINAIIMMAAGGGGGTILLIVGIAGIRRPSKNIDMQDGLFYGPDAWKVWNVEVLDIVPKAPQVDLSKKDKVLLYIPQRIRVNGEETDFTLSVLKEIKGPLFRYVSREVEEKFGNKTASGWVLIDKDMIPEIKEMEPRYLGNYEMQKKIVEDKGFSMPSLLEVSVLNQMVFAFTGKRLHSDNPFIYILCSERMDGKLNTMVGGFGFNGLAVIDGGLPSGTLCVQRHF